MGSVGEAGLQCVEDSRGSRVSVEACSYEIAWAVVQEGDQVTVAVVFDVCLPEAVWASSLPPFEASLPAWIVGFVDEMVLFEDRVDASVAYLDAMSFEVGFDGFAVPAVCSSDLQDFLNGFGG